MKEGRKPEYPEKTPGDELQKASVGQSLLRVIAHFALEVRTDLD